MATGPLTSDALSQDIARFVGAEHLAFYDAISPIVLAESIDRSDRVPGVAVGHGVCAAMTTSRLYGAGRRSTSASCSARQTAADRAR